MTDDGRCGCNHLASQHAPGGRCAECLCAGWHPEQRIETAEFHAGRWRLRLPEHRALRRENAWWEAARVTMTHELLGRWPGRAGRPLVVDVGAEEGDHPALWASWGADVFLIEPNPLVWPCIRASFRENRLGHSGGWVGLVGAEPRPAADPDPEPRRLLGPGEWPDCAYGPIVAGHGFHHLREHDADPVATVDQLVDPERPPWIVTIDVEGGEHAVLTGARQVLERDRPHVLVSIHEPGALNDWYGLERADVLRLLEAAGYRSQFLAHDHEQHWWGCPEEQWR